MNLQNSMLNKLQAKKSQEKWELWQKSKNFLMKTQNFLMDF